MSTTPQHEKVFENDVSYKIPRPFILRRLHSLMGLWLSLYLLQHLFINSMAAFYLEDDGAGYIKLVNAIHDLSYLRALEIILLAVPFFIHGVWGIIYLRTAKSNSFHTDGRTPSLPQYVRNRAYTWQRVTSWILLVGVIAHVLHMRFIDTPRLTYLGDKKSYLVKVKEDNALYGLAKKLHTPLYTSADITNKQTEINEKKEQLSSDLEKGKDYFEKNAEVEELEQWLQNATRKLKKGEIYADAPNAGVAFLLIVRDSFKSPLMVVLYSIFVVAAAYHGFNGLWTFLITWGVTLTRNSQKVMRRVTNGLIIFVTFLGLLGIWGTYYSTVWQKNKYGTEK